MITPNIYIALYCKNVHTKNKTYKGKKEKTALKVMIEVREGELIGDCEKQFEEHLVKLGLETNSPSNFVMSYAADCHSN
jgi:hypothetical protein